MPYIPQNFRPEVYPSCERLPQNAGELNYQLTSLITRYETQRGTCYQTMNDIIGALEGAKMEYYRRAIAPYEDIKIDENGDV